MEAEPFSQHSASLQTGISTKISSRFRLLFKGKNHYHYISGLTLITYSSYWDAFQQKQILVEGNQGFCRSYTSLKVCVECVTSLVTKVTNDDVTLMTS